MTPPARVVVTRSSDDADALARSLEDIGVEVIRLPTIAIEYPDDLADAATDAVDALTRGAYEWVLFSSRPGVTALRRSFSRRGAVARGALSSTRIAAVGAATVAAIERDFDRVADLVPTRFTGHDLVACFGEGPGRVLLPRPVDAPRSVIDELATAGWDAHELPLYRTVRGAPTAESTARVKAGDFDLVTFTSGSTAKFFVDLIGPPETLGLSSDGDKRVVVIGPSTEKVAAELGFRVDAVAEPHTTEGVVAAVSGIVGR